jgi:ligand-binding sensor domain-containing protein
MKYVLIFVLFFSFCSRVFAGDGWEFVDGIKESDIKEIVVNGEIVYVSSEKRLYRGEDSGKSWNIVFTARGEDAAINFIDIFKNAVYAATNKGLFKSIDGKTGWNKIFQGMGADENNVTHMAFNEGKIYLGTRSGLFVSGDNGASWLKNTGEAGSLNIKWIAFLEENVFLAAEKGVYKNTDSNWKRTFAVTAEETEYDADSTDEAFMPVKSVNGIVTNNNDVYLSTDSGIFISEDKGESWRRFESAGLGSRKVNRLIFLDIAASRSNNILLAATDKGVFVFDERDKIWRELYKGLGADKVNAIAEDDKGMVWAAAEKGVYKYIPPHLDPLPKGERKILQDDDILGRFNNEPTIKEVQKAAIEYAEVHPDKIKNWRKRAKIKAFLPEFSFDYDKTVTYDTGVDRYYIGPYDWGANVKWDLGEIIWNNDQTSIDTRSKLMVQLRDDVLDEVTRTYFERRRQQIDMILKRPDDLKKRLEKVLRIQELTADLDALTGGYFSDTQILR